MKKHWVALAAIALVCVGVAVSSWFWAHFYGELMAISYRTRTEADLVSKVAVLEHLRSGRITEATQLLETLLDSDLVSAAALARDGAKFTQKANQALVLAMKARQTSGYVAANEEVRRAVDDAFRLVTAAAADGAASVSKPSDQLERIAPSK